MNQGHSNSAGTAAAPPKAALQAAAGKYLIFNLANEEFGIQILKIREIIGLQDITFVPHTPVCVKGVINLRGKVIPVIDLRLKFEMPSTEYNERTCIIVISVSTQDGAVLTGVVVDSVSEVVNIAAADIEESPDFGDRSEGNYLLGMAKVKGKVKILLNIERVLATHAVLPSLH